MKWVAIVVVALVIVYGAQLKDKEHVGYLKGLLAGALVVFAIYTPIANDFEKNEQERVIKAEPKLIKQWQAGDDNVPETYQLWLVEGEKHMVVLPRR